MSYQLISQQFTNTKENVYHGSLHFSIDFYSSPFFCDEMRGTHKIIHEVCFKSEFMYGSSDNVAESAGSEINISSCSIWFWQASG